MTDHEQLVRLLATRSARTGNFTLASGRQSSLYIDARLTTMTPDGQRLIGRLGLQEIRDAGWVPDAVGGLTLGADPIAYAICHSSADSDRPIRAFTVRKEAKAVEAVRREGAIPVAVLALVDRQEGGREQLESLGLPVRALTTAAEIMPHIA